MEWENRHVKDTEAALDDSGVYVIVHRIEKTETHKQYSGTRVSVRADLMRISEGPIVSFEGTANAVRKALIRFIEEQVILVSLEHASYIGYELLRAETTENYVQD